MLLITLFSDDYRYAFNGMEYDNEIQAGKNSYTTEFRQYDPRLGRWKSLDPLMAEFPSWSPYVGFDNNPVYYNDPYGLASEVVNEGGPAGTPGTTGTYNGRAVAYADKSNDDYNNTWSIWFHVAGGKNADDNSTNGASYAEFLSWNPELDRDNGGTSAVTDGQMVYLEGPVTSPAPAKEEQIEEPLTIDLPESEPSDRLSDDWNGPMKVRQSDAFEDWILKNADQNELRALREAFGNSASWSGGLRNYVTPKMGPENSVWENSSGWHKKTQFRDFEFKRVSIWIRKVDSEGIERLVIYSTAIYREGDDAEIVFSGERSVKFGSNGGSEEFFSKELKVLDQRFNIK